MGRASRRLVDQARRNVANALGGDEKSVFFTSGATEANRWLVESIIHHGQNLQRPLNVVSSALEHPSLAKPLAVAHEKQQIALRIVDVTTSGTLDLPTTALQDVDVLCCTAAHNETGIIPRIEELVRNLPDETILIRDAAQAVARLPILDQRVDAVVASAHKIGGYPGAGAVLLRGRARRMPAPWSGGGQEHGLRPGTEAFPLLRAFGEAAAHIEEMRLAHSALKEHREHFEITMKRALSNIQIIGETMERLPNTSALTVHDVDGEALRMAVDMAGLCVGFGSACSALAPEPSPALIRLGLSRTEARATMRVSLAPHTTEQSISHLTKELAALIHRLRGSQ